MNHSQLVDALSQSLVVQKTTSDDVIRTLLAIIEDALVDGEEVTLLGLGKLKLKDVPARVAKNPQTGEPIQVPEKTKVVFSATSKLKQTLNPVV